MTVTEQIPQYIVVEKEKSSTWKKAFLALAILAIGGVIIFFGPQINAYLWGVEEEIEQIYETLIPEPDRCNFLFIRELIYSFSEIYLFIRFLSLLINQCFF